MNYGLRVRYEGPSRFTATDPEPKPVRVIVECPHGLPAGADVRVSIDSFRSYSPDWELEGIEIAHGDGRFVLGHGLPRAWRQMTRGGAAPAGGGLIGRPVGEIYLCTIQVSQDLSPGAQLIFALRAAVSPHAGVEGALLVKVRGPGVEAFSQVGEAMPLHNTPGPPSRLELRCTAAGDTYGQHRAVVFATDDMLNPVPDYQGAIQLKADGPVQGLPETVAIGPDGRSVLEGLAVAGGRPLRIEAVDPERSLSARSGPVGVATPDENRHYFGAIHFHTRLSVDGSREPERAYAYARDYLNLDVVAMTDHAPLGPLWETCLRVNEEFYEPGRFVTIPAWESSNAYGHANLYLRSAQAEAGPWYWNPEVCPSEVEWPADVVMVPHHTNAGMVFARGEHREAMDRGLYWTKYDWSMPNPRARLVEVVQGRGNFEADVLDATWGIQMGNQGASIQDAFALGWRLGFVAGTDNHEGHPTQRPGRYVGMTCFRAPDLTRESIWQAMDRRQTYATSGVPIVCDFWVNGVTSGGETTLSDATGSAPHVTFSACLHGTAPIDVVEIISNGRCVWRERPNRWDVELNQEELPAPGSEAHGASRNEIMPQGGRDRNERQSDWAYYYLRLRQADGHRAWLSPVWVTRL